VILPDSSFRRLRLLSLVGPNNAFKPKPLRSINHMAGRACHVVGSTARLGLT